MTTSLADLHADTLFRMRERNEEERARVRMDGPRFRALDSMIAALDAELLRRSDRRNADRVDGYDRDDLGESPDW